MNPSVAPSLDEPVLKQWIGKQQRMEDIIDLRPVRFLQATLDHPAPDLAVGDPLPWGWHWLYFLEAGPTRELGRDGHPKLGGFLPPVALPRRMWAGARLRFYHPILIGRRLTKTSTIKNVERKSGRSGELCFVTVKHRFFEHDTLKMDEEHDIVYREDPGRDMPAPSPTPAPSDTDVSETVDPTSTLLFRYSALTFNGHRIHYDLDYCRNVEGYPGLVVHAPLTATLMLDLATRHIGQPLSGFDFRATSPLFDNQPFSIHIKQRCAGYDLWAANPDGNLSMKASARV